MGGHAQTGHFDLLEFDGGEIKILDLPRVVAERDSRIEANRSDTGW